MSVQFKIKKSFKKTYQLLWNCTGLNTIMTRVSKAIEKDHFRKNKVLDCVNESSICSWKLHRRKGATIDYENMKNRKSQSRELYARTCTIIIRPLKIQDSETVISERKGMKRSQWAIKGTKCRHAKARAKNPETTFHEAKNPWRWPKMAHRGWTRLRRGSERKARTQPHCKLICVSKVIWNELKIKQQTKFPNVLVKTYLLSQNFIENIHTEM